MSEGQELFSGVSPQKRSSADGADVLLTMGSPSKRANLGKPSEFHESMLLSPSGSKFHSNQEDFSTFVENALSPLGKDFIGQSPMLKGLNSEYSNHGDDGSHVSASASVQGDWSPSVGSHSNLAVSEFKMNFDGPLSQSSSPLGSGGLLRSRIRMKKGFETGIYDGSPGTDDGAEDHNTIYHSNRQALAERLKDAGDSSNLMGVAETPLSSSSYSSHNMQNYLDSSLALDVGSPSPQAAPSNTAAFVGRGARERKATPKLMSSIAYIKQTSAGDTMKALRMHNMLYQNATTPTAEFSELDLFRVSINCNCKKSRCLKLYCECFHALKFCQNCRCFECENRVGSDLRDAVIKAVRDRDPHAFDSKVKTDPNSNSKGHLSGCHCKRTACLKKYCECFTFGVPCTQLCKCVKCQNNNSLYEIKVDEPKYTAAMLVSAAASAIDASGGDDYLTQATTSLSREDAASSDGYESRGLKTGRSSPESDGSKRSGYMSYARPVVPGSPSGLSLLDLAGACTEQARQDAAREGLLALSPLRRTHAPKLATPVMPSLPTKLDLSREI